jgi:hypothetical protein
MEGFPFSLGHPAWRLRTSLSQLLLLSSALMIQI